MTAGMDSSSARARGVRLGAVLLAAASAAGGPDRIELRDGRELEGRVVLDGQDVVRIRTQDQELEFPAAEVLAVHSLERTLAAVLEKMGSAPVRTSASELAALADACRQGGLDAEARDLWLRILVLDPTHEQAATALGCRKTSKGWQIGSGKSWRGLAEFLGPKPSFREALELETTHFLLRSDLELARLLDVAVLVERFHQRFYEALRADLRLCVLDDRPEIRLYGRGQDFPEPPAPGAEAWFESGANRLHVRGAVLDARVLIRGLTELLLFDGLRRTLGKDGGLPPWAAAGLGACFAAASGADAFDPWTELGAPDEEGFRAVAAARGSSLARVLKSGASQFRIARAPDEASLAAYTLVHFLLHGEGGRFRAPFFAYLERGWFGKSALPNLVEALGVQGKELEELWSRHVELLARPR